MLSIKRSLSELERWVALQEATLVYYRSAIETMAQYAVETDSELTREHRGHLEAIAASLRADMGEKGLQESRAQLRAELRDYRDKASRYLSTLQTELATTAENFEQLTDALSQVHEDCEERFEEELDGLRELARLQDIDAMRQGLLSGSGRLVECLEELKRQHQCTLGQFTIEIQMLHERIERLEAGAQIEKRGLTLKRSAIEDRIEVEAARDRCFSLAFFHIRDAPRIAEDKVIWEQLESAFAKRLANAAGVDAALGRWSEDTFVALLPLGRSEALLLSQAAVQRLAGVYVFVRDGASSRIQIEVLSDVADFQTGETGRSLLERAARLIAALPN